MKAIEIVSKEIQTAKEKYGPFNSTHELYGVLKEEVDEFFWLVRQQTVNQSIFDSNTFRYSSNEGKKREAMIDELSQIAAIALRGIDELQHNEIKWI